MGYDVQVQISAQVLFKVAPQKEMKMMRNLRVVICAAMLLIAALICCLSANADEGYLTKAFHADHQKLLQLKQQTLNDKAASVRNLNICDSWLKDCDIALVTLPSGIDRQNLLASKSVILKYKDQNQKDLDTEESLLLNLDNRLAWIEGEINRFSNMQLVHRFHHHHY